jgi:hypothetical protein
MGSLSETRKAGQFLNPNLSTPRGALQLGVNIASRLTPAPSIPSFVAQIGFMIHGTGEDALAIDDKLSPAKVF